MDKIIIEEFLYLLYESSIYELEYIKKVFETTKSFDKTYLAIRLASKLKCDLLMIAEAMKEEE